MNILMLAALNIGSGDGFVNNLFQVLILALACGVIYGIGWYFFRNPPFGAIAMKIWNGFFVLIGGIIILNFLLGLGGHSFIKW